MEENTILLRQLIGTPLKLIHETFQKAFTDYVEPFDLTFDEFKYMIERRGCDLKLSFGAFHNSKLVGFTLNGIGLWNGKLTAYDTGTGIIKDFRKKGIATRMFNESLPILRKNNIKQYLLEVICTNIGAYELYKKAGFTVVREFDYYISAIDKIKLNAEREQNAFQIGEINYPDWELLISFWEFHPSWQNSIDSIIRKIEHFKFLGLFKNEVLIGYGIIEKASGDIPQFAISKTSRRKGAATFLFKHLMNYSNAGRIKIINYDKAYQPFKKFMESINLHSGIGQYEMIMDL